MIQGFVLHEKLAVSAQVFESFLSAKADDCCYRVFCDPETVHWMGSFDACCRDADCFYHFAACSYDLDEVPSDGHADSAEALEARKAVNLGRG